ncbi:EAL domain-containing protein [Dasania marina]|mgnify:CR=1 FL=1|uniref:sensor domain-containing phosphodiesterase n=1 Tax=Dasania marina TaxID=471499 RepID=UPI0030D7CC04|tara:strand:+ start:14513 stop:16657 length:2145 start_codon:yes stop_codon:yes gene_type:complete
MTESKIHDVIRSISNVNNGDFLENITCALARVIDADYVFIANLDDDKETVKTLTFCADGQIAGNISYPLKSSPCEKAICGEMCIVSENVRLSYPDDKLLVEMGIDAYAGMPLIDSQGQTKAILVAMFETPLSSSKDAESLFLLFSGLICKELEKNSYVDKLSLAKKVMEQSKSGVIVCNSDAEIIYTNQAFSNITGYSQQEVLGSNPNVLSSGKQGSSFYESMWDEILTKGYWEGEVIDKRKNGELFPNWLMISALTNEKLETTHYVSNFYDITDRKYAEKTIAFQANYNALTHFPNKFLFEKLLQASIDELSDDRKLAVLLVDIDFFKDINDFYGHRFGDELLKEVAKRISLVISPGDTLAHFGSDDFAIIVNNIASQEQVDEYVNIVMESFADPFVINDINVKSTISCGAVCYPNSWPELDVFEMAEKAMYRAKGKGRNRSCFFSEVFHKNSMRRTELKNKLINVISNNGLDVFYQPIFCTKSKRVTKCEALVRWRDGDQWITPFEFIPIAEEFGLITDIGKIVLNKACEFLRELKDIGFTDLVVSVNRSVYEFPVNDADNNQWVDVITSYGLMPSDFCFELTESVLAPDKSNSLTMLRNLQYHGSTIALDDFGTGYSSLSYLRRFPIDFLKIDQSFVKEMTGNFDDKIIVSTIIAMAKTLNIKIIAEGAETLDQVRALTNLGCDYIQGYHFSKPLPPVNFIKYITNFTGGD